MIRKLAVALLGAGVLVPGLANALGLGEITNSSGLGQPLAAKIELIQTRDLTAEEIKVSLASQKDFDAAGVSRDYGLTELIFEVVVKPDGKSYVNVRSRRPLNEPYVNFLVEVLWPQGRLLREYTVLLDPPVTNDARRTSVTPPVAAAPTKSSPASASAPGATGDASSASSSTPTAQAPKIPNATGKPTWKVSHASPAAAKAKETSGPAAAPASEAVAKPVAEAAVKKTAAPVESGAAQYGPTTHNDSLWKIATKLRPTNAVSVHQTMVALVKNNPEAFVAGNMNLLKTGKTLQAPSAEQAEQLSNSDAIKEVARQNNTWREMIAGNKEGLKKALAGQQIQGSDASVSKPPAAGGPDGQLKLASSDTTSSTSRSGTGKGTGGGGGTAALEGKLTATEESLDKSSRENQDLKSHLGALKDEVAQSEKVLKLKDDQIAAMQAKLAQLEQEVAQAKANAAQSQAQVQSQPQVQTPANASSAASAAAQPAKVPVVEAAPQPDYNYHPQTPAATTATTPASEPSPAAEPVPQAATPAVTKLPEPQQAAPAQEPAAALQPKPAPTNPISELPPAVLFGVPVGALLVGLVLFLARKKKPVEEDFSDQKFELSESNAVAKEAVFAAEPTPVAESTPSSKETVATAAVSAAPSADPIAEADIYIAYRQFPRAVDVLEKAIAREPARADLRLKLLEVLVETGDKRSFEHHEAALANLGDTSAKVRGAELRATLFGAAATGALLPSLEDELSFAPDDTAFDHLAEFDASPAVASAVSDKNLDDLSLDFSFDIDQTSIPPQQPQASRQPAKVEDDFAPLEFTLDDSFGRSTANTAAVEEIIATPVANNSLDFSFDLASTAEAAADAGPEHSLLDEDLPFESVEDFGSTVPDLDSSHIADASTDADFSLDLELPSSPTDTAIGDGPLLAADEPILMPSIVDEDIATETADFAFDPMTGEFEPATNSSPIAAPTAAEAEDLEFLAGSDEISTKLDLARAYIDMGDSEGAKDILDEVVVEGNDAQKSEARELISRLEA